tara:strand:+ start:497 stop:682 length:186 start_codon:yes stop_codon:yes gene_type:complete
MKLISFKNKRLFSMIGFDNKLTNAIETHFRLNNSQMILLFWLKGVWTGILFSLVLHFYVAH